VNKPGLKGIAEKAVGVLDSLWKTMIFRFNALMGLISTLRISRLNLAFQNLILQPLTK
jgi:hypothetical protein